MESGQVCAAYLDDSPVKLSTEEGNDNFRSQAGNRVAVGILAALVVSKERIGKGDGIPVFHAGFLLLLAVITTVFDVVVVAGKDETGASNIVFRAPRRLRLCKVTQEEDDSKAPVQAKS
jgi:hypothetical protein